MSVGASPAIGKARISPITSLAMTPREQLLCFLAVNPGATDPVRIMKGLFLFAQAVAQGTCPNHGGTFEFHAMNFGPCAPAIYNELRQLTSEGFAEEVDVPGETWKRYRLTNAGRNAAQHAINHSDGRTVNYIERLRAWCDLQTFTSLLRNVYRAHPEFAVNSVLPHLRPNG